MDFSQTLIRSSALGTLLTGEPGKPDIMGKTAKTYLNELYVSLKYGREKDIESKYITKGLGVEEDSITLYSKIKKKFYKKNAERLTNKFISGHPDIYEGPDIKNATFIPDIKSSWDLFTFFANASAPVKKDNYWQIQGYCWLTGAPRGSVANCLIDTPLQLISDEQRRLQWKMGVATQEDPLYIEACEKLEKNMLYGDIPLDQRLIELPVERNDADIEKIAKRVEEARVYLNQLEEAVLRTRKNLVSEYIVK